MSDLTDTALRVWAAHFLTPGNTLTFGGDGAEMEITPEARAGLDELVAHGAVKRAAADCQVHGREKYQATEVDLRDEIIWRAAGTNLFEWLADSDLGLFRKRAQA